MPTDSFLAKMTPPVEQAVARMQAALVQLRETLQQDIYREDTPLEVQEVMENAASAMAATLDALKAIFPETPRPFPQSADLPTPKQGQFLAYIHEYIRRNHAGVAPTHALLQRFFNLTPPSVNSMLIRLEQRGFICRAPGQARGITLLIDPAMIPELDRPFK
jgi:repressor LexA